MSVCTIQHLGKEIILVDYTQCKTPEQTVEVVNQAERFLMAYHPDALVLADVTGAPGSAEYMARAKEVSKKVNHKVKKRAIVGITGLKKVLFHGYTRMIKGNIMPFDTRDQALQFLID